MNERHEDREFIDAVKADVRRSLELLENAHPGERLVGYVLFTDDGLATLFCRAVTAEALAGRVDPELLFAPADWPCEDGAEAMGAADGVLRGKAAAATDFAEHVEGAFADLVQSLAELRATRAFGPEVFLSVASTDPGAQLLRLEEASIERLNSSAVAQARREFVEKWK